MRHGLWTSSACAALAWWAVAVPAAGQECQAVKIDCLQPRALARIEGARFLWGTTGGDTADAWVARYDGDARELTWRIEVAGVGEESVATVTLNRGGAELLVAGATTSPSLEGFAGQGAGGRDGFVARLDAATGRLLSGALVGGKDDDELTGVVSDKAGRILVSGVGTPFGFGEMPAGLTVVEAEAAVDSPRSPVFVATFDGQLEGRLTVASLGDLQVQSSRAWTDCEDGLVVGTAILGPSNCVGGFDLHYDRSFAGSDYLTDHLWGNPFTTAHGVPGGWGYQALRWKQYHAQSKPAPWATTQLSFAGHSDIPQFGDDFGYWPPLLDSLDHPGCTDVPKLNQLEAQTGTGQLFFPADPPGGWDCGQHSNMAELALFTAHLMHLWKTPVYAHFNQPTGGSWRPYAAGIDRVTFVPVCDTPGTVYDGKGIEDLCFTPPPGTAPSPYYCDLSTGIPGILGAGYTLAVKSFEGSSWGPDRSQGGGWFTQGRTWESDAPPWFAWYDSGDFVFDPPEGGEEEVARVQELVHGSAGLVLRPGKVQVTRVTAMGASCGQTVDAYHAATE